jgi:hypothetical protein
MGHFINAIIAQQQTLSGLAERFGQPEPTELAFGLVILPLDDTRLDQLALSSSAALDGFTYLTLEIGKEIARSLHNGPALYIETEYFGGTGGQGAAFLEGGRVIWTRSHSSSETYKSPSLLSRLFRNPAPPSKSPISEGLSMLGVIPSAGNDEFDELGLVRFRSLEALGIEYED